jgi:ABC-type multidrug transport system ATPase subunit
LLIDEQADRLVEAVRVVGIEPDVLDRLPRTFTPFELQRLALARALVGRPSLIVLDEPTMRLDPVEQAEFLVLFNRVRSDYGLTVLCASREFDVLRLVADRILVLERGRIVEGGKPGELFENRQHEATRALLTERYPEPPPPLPPEPVVDQAPEERATPVAGPMPTVEPAPAPVPETAPATETVATHEPEPDPEPLPPSPPDPAEEPAEGRQVEQPIDGQRDGAGSVEPAQNEAVR